MSTRSQPNNVPPNADLAIPFLERVLINSPFPPIAILLPRPFAHYDNDIKLEVTAVTTTGDIHIIKREVERYRFGLSPCYRPDDRVYLVMDMYGFGLPAAGTWRFQIKGHSWIDRKQTEVLSIIQDEVTEAVTAENYNFPADSMRLSVPQEWLLWMTKTTSQFRYRINPDVALTFQIRAPVQPAPVQPAEPPRPRGRPRKIIADADPQEQDGMIDVDNNGYTEDGDVEVFEAENAEGCELSVVLSVEQDEVDNVNHINYYGEIPADANLQIGGGVDDMDALQDDDDDDDDVADELTLVGDSEDDAVQHERPQFGMKTLPASYYDDAGLVTDIEDVTLDSFDLEEGFPHAKESIDPEDLENEFFEREELLDAPAGYLVTPAGQSSDHTTSGHHVGTEIMFAGDSDSLDGLFTDDEENDLDASDFEDKNHPHVDIQTDETAGSSLEQDDETTSTRGNYARHFYPVLSPIPQSPATMPKANSSPSRAVIKAQVAPSLSQVVASATENAIRTAGKGKRLNHRTSFLSRESRAISPTAILARDKE